MRVIRLLLVLGGIVLAGCGGKDAGQPAGAGAGQGGMAGMKLDSGRMGGPMGMGSMGMMPGMRAHMDSMMRRSPAEMARMMATHERMMSQMMDRMGADMRGMSMAGSAGWSALTDSVKRDLGDLPGLEGEELSQRMRAHADRVRRLLGMHEGMMKGM
jgi:hypothetical protein